MPIDDEDNLNPLEAFLNELQSRSWPGEPSLPQRQYLPNPTPAIEAIHSMTNAGYFDGALVSEYGLTPGMKTGRLRFQDQHGTGTMSVAQLTRKILTLDHARRIEEDRRDHPTYTHWWLDHSPMRLERILRELAGLKRELLSRLLREHEAREAAILKDMAELETELFEQLPPPPAEPPPGEILTETIVIAPGAPAR